ncbi:MAG: patatin-like phospholipase family protein [Myxococcales bacterium]
MAKRAIIMAGGGVKVAFQAGVLQVWLDEAGLTFDHGDGASGGVFNLAMWCQGMTGTQIADAWRRTVPVEGVSLNLAQLPKLLWARSLFTLDAYRKHVFPGWGLDWDKIRASSKQASFNVYNFSKHRLEVLSPAQMNEDRLCACVSLPMWFEPVRIDGDTYIDAVFRTDGNLEEAIRLGADELWVIWTVSLQGTWNDGFVANYFQIIEASANSHFKRQCERIEANNAAIDAGKAGEFGRKIALKVLQAEVPMHYLVNFSQDRLVECVNLGVQQARRWCGEQGIPLTAGEDAPTDVHTVQTKLQFTEEMKGYLSLGESDYEAGYLRGKKSGTTAMFHLTIKVDGVNHFVTHPQHEAGMEGYVDCPAFGGRMQVLDGAFNLFVDDGDPHHKFMYYRIWFSDGEGKPKTLLGFKDVKDDPGFDVWSDTTTLFTRIYEGHIAEHEEGTGKVLAAGILKIPLPSFLRQLTTFRTEGPTLTDRTAALARFGALFMGSLWDVYATHVLSSGPV